MKYQKGIAPLLLVGIVAVVLIVGGAVYYSTQLEKEILNNEDLMMEKEDEAMMEEDKTMEEGENMMEISYKGEVLAGSKALLLDFNNSDYKKALAEKKIVVLYFYANWCPTCKAEFPKMQSAFNKLTTDDVIGFRVNYNDNETDSFEKDLAKEFGVAYQHTKVILKNGERVLKSPETWDEDRYASEINNLIK